MGVARRNVAEGWISGPSGVMCRRPTCVNSKHQPVAGRESQLGVRDQTAQLVGGLSAAAKLFGQPQYACAFCEPVRDCLHHADLEDHAEPKSRF